MYKIQVLLLFLTLVNASSDYDPMGPICSTDKAGVFYKNSQDKLKDILPGIARQYLHNHVIGVEHGNWTGIIIIMKFDDEGSTVPSVETMATTDGQIDVDVNRLNMDDEMYSSSDGRLTFHMEERHNSEVFIILVRTNIDDIVNVSITYYNNDGIICQKTMA